MPKTVVDRYDRPLGVRFPRETRVDLETVAADVDAPVNRIIVDAVQREIRRLRKRHTRKVIDGETT